MKKKTAVIHSKKLTKEVKKIFGNIVKSEYIKINFFPEYGDEKELILSEKMSEILFKKNIIQYDTVNIIIEFTNNRSVLFCASEWAHFISHK